jgi:MFS family permease
MERKSSLKERLKNELPFFRGNYMILIMSWILMDFAGELPGTYYSDYVIQLGGTPTIIGVIMAVSLVCLASVQFLGGYLADKYGRRWLISTLTFGIGLSFIFFAAAPSQPLTFMGITIKGWHFILLGAAIQNLCLLYQPALFAMIADSVPPEKRGMGFSLVNLIMSVSTTPAPIVALMLVATYGSLLGMRIAYAIVIVLYLVAAVVRLRLKESMKNTEKINVRQMLRSYPQAMKEGIGIWKKVPRSTRFLFFSELIARSAMAMAQMLFLVYAFYVLKIGGTPNLAMAPELDPALQQARIMWGYVMTVLFMSMIALSFPVGKLLDKAGRRIPLIISNLLVIPSTLILIYGNYLTLYIALPLMGFSALLTFSSYQALFADLVPQAQRGKVTGSNHFFTYLGTAVTGAIGGFTYEAVSPQTPFLLTIILIIPSTAILLFRVKEPKPEERQA